MISNLDENNLTTYRGDDLAIKLKFTDTNNVAINITGWTITMTIKKTSEDSDAKATIKYLPSDIPNPTLGELIMLVSNTITNRLAGSYWYDIQVLKTDLTIQTITHGSIYFTREKTLN